MRYNEEWVNNFHCIINTEQRMSSKELLAQYKLQRQSRSGQSDQSSIFGMQYSMGRSAGLRLFLYIMGILLSVAAIVLTAIYASDSSYLGGISIFLGIGTATLLACVSGIISVVLKHMAHMDPVKSKVLPFIGFVASGVLVVVGLASQSEDIVGWLKATLIVIFLFIVVFFISALFLVITERTRVYTKSVEAVCTGYVRYVSKDKTMDSDQPDYRVSISPIFEYDSVKVCYDTFSPRINSDIPMGAKVFLHLGDEDKYMVQPELKIRVTAFSIVAVCFLIAAIALALLL